MMGLPGLVSKRKKKKKTIQHVFVLLFFFILYLVACAMVNVYKGIGKENCALLFVCFCIFSVMNCRKCQLSMCACVCTRIV